MHEHGFLIQALVYLAAATFFVPLFQRLGLGSVLGYLVAGVVIGPQALGLITDIAVVNQVSELGVVLLLFLIGLELNPARLWELRRAIFGLGTMQVLATTAVVTGLSGLLGLTWQAGILIGMATSMSSTAIALQILGERNQVNGRAGQSAFAVSLFQDLAVIPMLLIVAALATSLGAAGAELAGSAAQTPANSGGVPPWARDLGLAVGIIGAMVLGGRLVLRPLLRFIASTGMREIFIAFALLLIVGSAWLTLSVGLSMALGSFIAGLLLADSEYRMELQVDIDPFKGLLLGLFFIAVGMGLDLQLIFNQPLLVIGLALLAVVVKLVVLFGVARVGKLLEQDSYLFAFSISAVGEFAFVLLTQGRSTGLLTQPQAALANAVVAVSMLTTPLLFILFDKVLMPRYRKQVLRETDVVDEGNPVVIAGVGRFGQIPLRMLSGRKIGVTVIDHDPDQVDSMRRFGWRSFYGDARRPDVLEAAGLAKAKVVLLAMDDARAVVETAHHIKKHFPQVKVIARARSRVEAIELNRIGVLAIRETFGSAMQASQQILVGLGDSEEVAQRVAAHFKAVDLASLARQATVSADDEAGLIAIAAQGRKELEEILQSETGIDPQDGGVGASEPLAPYTPLSFGPSAPSISAASAATVDQHTLNELPLDSGESIEPIIQATLIQTTPPLPR
jgi:monovalent cation:proton antiporter-2 (CPA2) family protein